MADKPLAQPLAADLPENWNPGQIVAPNGVDVGLPEQYGYNYLMAAVNSARRAINTVNEGFETISGKRTARFTVGTSIAGWEEADCDYLCDGVDDQEQLNAACAAAAQAGGGTVLVLAGEYQITGQITVGNSVTLRGDGSDATILYRNSGSFPGTYAPMILLTGSLADVCLTSNVGEVSTAYVSVSFGGGMHQYISRVTFFAGSDTAIYTEGAYLWVDNCWFITDRAIDASDLHTFTKIFFAANEIERSGCSFLASGAYVCVTGTFGTGTLDVCLDKAYPRSIVMNNNLGTLQLLNTDTGTMAYSTSCLITDNVFNPQDMTAIILGVKTRYNFVTGNQLSHIAHGDQFSIQDNGEDNIVQFNSNDKGSSLITYGTTDLTPGVSDLPTGKVYLVYE